MPMLPNIDPRLQRKWEADDVATAGLVHPPQPVSMVLAGFNGRWLAICRGRLLSCTFATAAEADEAIAGVERIYAIRLREQGAHHASQAA